MPAAIETSDLTKFFGDVKAVDRLSMCVGAGEIYGFLGLNGAGKTTTIRMPLGMVRPTAGTVRVLGEEIRSGSRGPWSAICGSDGAGVSMAADALAPLQIASAQSASR